MDKWLRAALDYLPNWTELQVRQSQQPGCIVAIAHNGQVILEQAIGSADLATGETLTPRHRFRVASHSKSFTAAGILLLRERGKLRLDDEVGAHVSGLNRRVARTTLGQLLSHSAGIVRDGPDSGQFVERRAFLSREELLADLHAPPAIEPNTRFKYSNHGFALLGLVIEAAGDTPCREWIKREVMDAAGLAETEPDMPLMKQPPARQRRPAQQAPFARGHTARWLSGQRLTVPGDSTTHAIAPAGGFVSTASDLVRFFAQLDPEAPQRLLSAASRREMIRPQWRNPHASLEGHYGLGIMSGRLNGWDWFGHSGALLGYISRTAVLRQQALAVSVLTNAVDGWAGFWVDGIIQILQTVSTRGMPTRRVSGWTGRWWSAWGAIDLVPMGDRVLIANPHLGNPFLDVGEIAVTGRDSGRIALANGYSSHGEPVRRTRDQGGQVASVWLGGSNLQPEATVTADVVSRYGGKSSGRAAGRSRRTARTRP